MKKLVVERLVKCVLLSGMLLFVTMPAFSQISYATTDKHKHGKLVRKSLREANQVDASVYGDTHLNMDAYTFKKGETGKVKRQPWVRLFKARHEASQHNAADREKKRFHLFRKKEK
jgi:ribosomal protein L25 (general stress protein Ctc)